MDLSIVIAFFSPVEYELPRKHFLATLEMLKKYKERFGFEVIVSQVIAPWQKTLPVPEEFFSDHYITDHVLFYKDNLWNLATTRTTNTNFVFLDADVYFENDDWVERIMSALGRYEIIQPFETCAWLTENGKRIECEKQSAAVALSKNKRVDNRKYHVGFGWGCTRDGWDKIGGWFDANASGSNDTGTALAFEREGNTSWTRRWYDLIGESSPAWREYRENVQAKKVAIGYAEGNRLLHRWHGQFKDRQYKTRHHLFPRKKDGNNPIHKNKEGLWQWDSAEDNEGPKKYFERRRDDG
jgi:hypothetical protein